MEDEDRTPPPGEGYLQVFRCPYTGLQKTLQLVGGPGRALGLRRRALGLRWRARGLRRRALGLHWRAARLRRQDAPVDLYLCFLNSSRRGVGRFSGRSAGTSSR